MQRSLKRALIPHSVKSGQKSRTVEGDRNRHLIPYGSMVKDQKMILANPVPFPAYTTAAARNFQNDEN